MNAEVVDNRVRADGQKLIDLAPDEWTALRFMAACEAAQKIIEEKNLAEAKKLFSRLSFR